MALLRPYNYILIDCHNLAWRHWWHLRGLRNSADTPTGLEYGFLNGLLGLIRRWKPAVPILVWDGRPLRCLEIFPVIVQPDGSKIGYKSKREDLALKAGEPTSRERFAVLRDSLKSLIPTLYHPEREADEEIARWVDLAEKQSDFTLICARDDDMNQLVSDFTHLNAFDRDKSSGEEIIRTPGLVRERWGVPPEKLPLYRALTGDVSDSIPGITRIPKKLIMDLVNRAHDIHHLIHIIQEGKHIQTENQRVRLQQGQDQILRNYHLMQLQSQRSQKPSLLCSINGDMGPLTGLLSRLEIVSLRDAEEWSWVQTLSPRPLSPGVMEVEGETAGAASGSGPARSVRLVS